MKREAQTEFIPARRRCALLWLALALAGLALYLSGVPGNPPGFFADESSIAYNAHLIGLTGRDEHGASWPLFFRAFGEYKSPVYVYLLAAVYALAGPSITAARALSALLGAAAALLLGLVAARSVAAARDAGPDENHDGAGGASEDRDVANAGHKTREEGARACAAGLAVAVSALLTPWLFEVSRLVFEVALMPLALALLLLAVRAAHERGAWTWRDSINVALALALVTYTYSVGRLLAPLLALGLVLFAGRPGGRRAVLRTWLLYAVALAPLTVFVLHNPDALTARFAQVSFVKPGMTWAEVALRFFGNYAAAFDPRSWLITGDPEPRHHVQTMGSLLAATVAASAAGLLLILRRRKDAWWRFILYGLAVAPLPSSLTIDYFHTLRLVAVPVFLLALAAPALADLAGGGRVRRAVFYSLLALTLMQGAVFQYQFRRDAPHRLDSFDAFFPEVFDAALARPERPIYIIDGPGAAGYIHAYWYGTLRRLDTRQFVPLPRDGRPPAGALVISTEAPCDGCEKILERGAFRASITR